MADRVTIEFVRGGRRGGLWARMPDGTLKRYAARQLVPDRVVVDLDADPAEIALACFEAGVRYGVLPGVRAVPITGTVNARGGAMPATTPH